MKGAKMCKEGLQLKQISPHLTQKTTQNLMVVVCCQSWYPSYLLHLLMLPALMPNARRDPWHTQMRPSPKSVHPVASVARCNANGAPGSVSQNLMDRCWWTDGPYLLPCTGTLQCSAHCCHQLHIRRKRTGASAEKNALLNYRSAYRNGKCHYTNWCCILNHGHHVKWSYELSKHVETAWNYHWKLQR